jgi:hydroxyacylglutathione hydrolase
MEIKLFTNYDTQGNSYVVEKGKDCYIVDPGGRNMSPVIDYIKEKDLNLVAILLTHGHFDHIIGTPEILEYKDVPVYISEKGYDFLYDPNLSLSTWIRMDFRLSKDVKVIKMKEGDEVFGFKIIEIPGHTHGDICFYDEQEKIMISGDIIFKGGSYGRTDVPTGNYEDLKKSIVKLMKMDGDIRVYPGHGSYTYIKDERKYHNY